MASVSTLVQAYQEGASSLRGVLIAPLPGLETAVWVPTTTLGSYNVIGADTSAVYIRSEVDFTATDFNVTRVDVVDGTATVITGTGVGRYIGATYLALPVGDTDVVLFGRDAIIRVQGDTQLWRIDLSGLTGQILADAAVVSSGAVTVIYQRAVASRPEDYRKFTFSLTSPPSTSDASTWPLYTVDWDAIDLAGGVFSAAGLMAAIAPAMEYGVYAEQTRSPDGWVLSSQHVLTGAFIEGGLPTTSYYGNFFGPSVQLATVVSNVTMSGDTVVDADTTTSALASTTADIPLPALDPGYDSWGVSEVFGFSLSFEAPEIPPFWTNLRRAAEQI